MNKELLKQSNLDAYLIYDFRGSNFIGREILGFTDMTTRRWVAIIDGETTHYLIAKLEKNIFANVEGEKHYFGSYDEFHEQLKMLLSKYKRVGIDYSPNADLPMLDIMPSGLLELLKKLSPETEFVSAANLTQSLAANWGEVGYRTHKEAAAKLETIFDETFEYIRRNLKNGRSMTDFEVMQFVVDLQVEAGLHSDGEDICIVAVDEDSANPHYWPQEFNDEGGIVKANSVLLLDIWARTKEVNSVYADFTKLAWIGPDPIPEKLAKVWDVYRAGFDMALEFLDREIGRGIEGWEVDKLVREHFIKHGYSDNLLHRTGHSLGRKEHGNGANLDDFESHDTRVLLPGTGFTIEPGIYLPEFGVRWEVDVFVKEQGSGVEVTTPWDGEIVSV